MGAMEMGVARGGRLGTGHTHSRLTPPFLHLSAQNDDAEDEETHPLSREARKQARRKSQVRPQPLSVGGVFP